jgi:hypothetical protein
MKVCFALYRGIRKFTNVHETEYSVRKLFGHECSDKIFRHDAEIRDKQAKKAEMQKYLASVASQQTQTTASSPPSQNQAISHFMRRGSLASLPQSPKREIRRNSQGKLRLHDENGEVSFPSQPLPVSTSFWNVSAGSQGSIPSTQPMTTKTPPRNASGWSPGSASQEVRRKRIFDELETGPAKRQRLLVDGSGSSPARNEVAAKSQSPVFLGVETILGSKSQMAGMKQTRPDRVKPVQNVAANPMSDSQIQENVQMVRRVLPHISLLAAKNALVACKGSVDNAIFILGGDDAPAEIIDISDNEMYTARPAIIERGAKIPVSVGTKQNVPADVDDSTKPKSFVPTRTTQADVKISTELHPTAGINVSTGAESSGESSHADTPGSEVDSDREEDSFARFLESPLYSAFVDENGEEITYPDDYGWDRDYMDLETFFDPVDEVLRCKICYHEVWSSHMGFCTGCKEGQSGTPYYEILESGGKVPKFELNEHPSAEASSLEDVTGSYLDCNSSAYDSQDEEKDFTEEYEINSFIDDRPEEDTDDEEENPEEEIDWEERYRNIAAAHAALSYSHQTLNEKYHEYRKAIEGDDYESTDDSDMGDEFDEDGLLVVDVAVQDLVVTELVLSQAREQEEEISPDRVRDRVEAFEAASNENGRVWQDISMVSTGDNHTFPEIEL